LKMKFLKFNQDILAATIRKLDLKILLIIIIDFIFYGLAYLSSQFWFNQIKLKYDLVSAQPNLLSEAAIRTLFYETQGFYFFLIYSLIFLIISIFIFSAIAKGLIWALTARTKITIKYLLRFTLLKLLWNLLFLAIIVFSFIVLTRNAAIILTLISLAAAYYFSNIIYPLFTKINKLYIIKEGVSLGLRKFHMMLLPYAIIIITGLLMRKIYFISTSRYWVVFTSIITLIYLAVNRYYLSTLTFELE